MAESKEINPDTWGDFPQSDGEVEQIPNKERGCGYLKANNAYVRCDPRAFSKGGALPGFVVLVDSEGNLDPIPYKESLPRGYETLNGSNFMAAAETIRNFQPLYPGGPDAEETHAEAHQGALENMVEAGAYESVDQIPESELARHLDRMAVDGVDGEHWGEITPANSKDLMMRAGKSYYEEPWDFIDEALELGLNKGISVHGNKSPPVVQPGRTRMWIIHPHACGEDMPGVVGFSYLTRTIYTRDMDGDVPKYAQDYAESGQMDIVDIGEPEPREDDEDREGEDVAESHRSLDEFDLETEGRDTGYSGRLADAPETVEHTGSPAEPQQIEELEKADLGELAGRGWVDAHTPPEDQSAIHGNGNVMALVEQGSLRKITGTNPGSVDPTELGTMADQALRTSLGPYIVTVAAEDGQVQRVLVEQR